MFIPWSFSPLVLRPALWLDASDASTLYDATIGGSLVAADSAIARWEDKSGNGRHATQATGVQQPLRIVGAINGRDSCFLDEGNDGMITPLNIASGNMTLCVVYLRTIASGFPLRAVSGSNNWLMGPYGSDYQCYAGTFVTTSVPVTIARRVLHTVTMTTGGELSQYLDGSAAGSLSGATYPGNINLGASGAFLEGLGGNICEVLVFPTALSDADRQSVEAYLNAKWAIY